MTTYHVNSRADIEAQFSAEGDLMRQAGFKEPNFSDEPEEKQFSLTGSVVAPITEVPTAYDAAAAAGRVIERELEG